MTINPEDFQETKKKRTDSSKAEYDLIQNAVKAGDVKLEITPKEVPQ